MLTFKQYIREQLLIIETNVAAIKQHNPDKANHIDSLASSLSPQHHKYIKWAIHRTKPEETADVAKTLQSYDTLKSNPKFTGHSDINKYKSHEALKSAVESNKDIVSGKEEKKQTKSEGAELIHNDKELGVTVHHIKTEKASCQYGSGTKWCTTGEKDNKFDEFNRAGPIHIIQHQGRKYQFHNDSFQMMDEKNEPTQLRKLHPDIQKSLAKSNHPEIQKANILFQNRHITPEHINQALNHKDWIVRSKAVLHPNVQPEHVEKALKDENPQVREAAEFSKKYFIKAK
jgi:hypothetical protein